MSEAGPVADARGRPRRGRWRLACRLVLLGTLLGLLVVYFAYVLPFWGVPFNRSRHGRVPLTPPWALECWLWEDDVNTGAYVEELLAGYAEHDLPVRTLLIDSPWSMRYNDFKVDEVRYPQPEKFFGRLQERGYRVVLWMTCMVNSRGKDTRVRDSEAFFEEARTNGFLAGDGYQLGWWKGKGGFIDYSNASAMKWWHGLQQQVLDWGVDGWKLDGADTLFSGRLGGLPVPWNRVASGWMTTRQYMDNYARDEYQHGLSRNPEFCTLIRALDHPWSHPEGFAPLDAAPVTWVGDKRHAWRLEDRGIEAALRDMLASARLGYCVVGSDVAGYHGRGNPEDIAPSRAALAPGSNAAPERLRTAPSEAHPGADPGEIAPELYIRWAQLSAFCGLFLNGGHGERRLWKRTRAELEIVRKFSWLHTELVPYIYSHVVECHRGGPPLMRPLSGGSYQYLFGADLLVAPVHENSLERTISLPAGGWRYLFDDRQLIEGPATLTRQVPLDEFPVFVREGAVIPLKVQRAYSGFGDRDSAGFTTWLIYPKGRVEFTLHHPESHPAPTSTTVRVTAGESLQIDVTGQHEPHILRILAEQRPVGITLDGRVLPPGAAWTFDPDHRRIVVKTREYGEGRYVISWR